MNKIQAIKGTNDILPGDVEIWQKIESVVRKYMRIYGFSEIRTPVFEETGLFARSIGRDTDIVGKEMYTFRDMGDRSLTLRPEGTASVVRAFIEHSLNQKGLPRKLWYMGPMFRQERPQKGRQRQFHQFGVEYIGSNSEMVDAHVMIIFDDIAQELGLTKRIFSINSLGGAESRKSYKQALVNFLDTIEDRLCEDCKRRKVTNPFRVLDCKVPGCREVIHNSKTFPKTVDHLTFEDTLQYGNLKGILSDYNIEYKEDPFLVRGLDYYTGAIFEMNYEGLGAQSAIMGGGRYDSLIKDLGGPDLPAVGFACGMERLILAMQTAGSAPKTSQFVQVYVISPDRNTVKTAFKYVQSIIGKGYSATMDLTEKSMKSQMKAASKLGAKFALIVEPEENNVSVRDMEKSEQRKMPFREFINLLEKTKMLKKIT